MGRHTKPRRTRIARALPIAVPALAGAAVVLSLAPQASASPIAAKPHTAKPAAHKAVTTAARSKAKASKAKASKAATSWYTVKSGDSLSEIAGAIYHNTSAWPVIYWANHGQIKYADIIQPGQKFRIPASAKNVPGAPSQLAPVSAPAPVSSTSSSAAAGTGSAASTSATSSTSSASSSSSSASTDTSSSGTPGGSFGACVVERESGGNSQVMNSSGHYGLYQFSESTWVAYGGSAADFGHASVAEQNAVFATAIADGGESNWAPYDGC